MPETTPMVFVVDDDSSIREALARFLRSTGLRVETYASSHEFLPCQNPDVPACLVLDVHLCGENGLALQNTLRSAGCRLPIIFLTGYGTIPMCAHALKAGAVDFLQKPWNDQELLAAIDRALDQDRRACKDQRYRAELHQRMTTLTPRERQVLALVVTGRLNKQVADVLGTSEKTVKVHRARVMQKMQSVARRAGAHGRHAGPGLATAALIELRNLPQVQTAVLD